MIGLILYTLAFGGIASETGGGALFGIILLIGYLILQIYIMAKSTSLGKKLLGLKVYNKDTKRPVGFWMMLVREVIGKFISGLIFGEFIFSIFKYQYFNPYNPSFSFDRATFLFLE